LTLFKSHPKPGGRKKKKKKKKKETYSSQPQTSKPKYSTNLALVKQATQKEATKHTQTSKLGANEKEKKKKKVHTCSNIKAVVKIEYGTMATQQALCNSTCAMRFQRTTPMAMMMNNNKTPRQYAQ
jgi:hypothetical protein